MSFFKSLIVPCAAVGAICGVLAYAAPSKAASWDLCMPFAGGEICANYGHRQDVVRAHIPYMGTEDFTISCLPSGYDATSRGDWSRSEAESFVDGYCSSRSH